MKKIHVGAAIAVALAAGAAANANPAKTYDTSINAILGPAAGSTYASRSVNEFYGFETAEGYAVGALSGQQGWTEFVAAPGAGRVSSANPATGNQHLRIVETASGNNGVFSPDLGAQPAGFYRTTLDVAINDAGGADYDVLGQAPSQGFLSWRVKFNWQGNILILDDVGAGLGFIDTGIAWNLGLGYSALKVDMDANANSIDYYYDGNLIYSSVAGVFAGSSVEQVVIFSDGFQFFSDTLNPTGDFDNISIAIPAPGAVALFAMGGIASIRRRR